MKNVIKKIAAITTAFTLLGTGTAITKNINPQSGNVGLTAEAACSHNMPRTYYSSWIVEYQGPTGKWKFDWGLFRAKSEWEIHEKRAYYSTCNSCGTRLSSTKYQTRVRYEYR